MLLCREAFTEPLHPGFQPVLNGSGQVSWLLLLFLHQSLPLLLLLCQPLLLLVLSAFALVFISALATLPVCIAAGPCCCSCAPSMEKQQ